MAVSAALLASNATGATVAPSPASPSGGAATAGTGIDVPPGSSTQVFASGGSLSPPDDITLLGGNVFVAYRNGRGRQRGGPDPLPPHRGPFCRTRGRAPARHGDDRPPSAQGTNPQVSSCAPAPPS